jgi:hypothetical protein
VNFPTPVTFKTAIPRKLNDKFLLSKYARSEGIKPPAKTDKQKVARKVLRKCLKSTKSLKLWNKDSMKLGALKRTKTDRS